MVPCSPPNDIEGSHAVVAKAILHSIDGCEPYAVAVKRIKPSDDEDIWEEVSARK